MFFNYMIRVVGFRFRIEYYGCMVDFLVRNGFFKDVEKFIFDMFIKLDDVIWKVLLGVCKMYGEIEMGRRVVKYLMEMVFLDSGFYVVLLNMYAFLGDWDGVV